MSLKAFHIFFITLSIMLAIGFGVWEILAFLETSDTVQLAMGIGSFAVAGGLAVYGIRFLRKLKHIGYL